MKAITLLVAIFLPAMLHASQPRLTTITLPLWYLGSAASDEPIVIAEVPKIHSGTDADAWVALFGSPVRPEGGNVDINLISIYRIRVTATADKHGRISRISIDRTKANKPNGYPFSIDLVATKAAQCIRREFADRNQTRIFMVHDGKEMEYEPTKGEKDGRRDGDKPTN